MNIEEEQQVDLREALIADIPAMEAARSQKRDRLLEMLRETDRANLVSQAALTYLLQDPETFKEYENDRPAAHVEYLALQAAGVGLASDSSVECDPRRLFNQTGEAMQLVREIFNESMLLSVARLLNESQPDKDAHYTLEEFQLRARESSMVVRCSGYPEHLDRVIRGCLDPFENECCQLLGFTAREAVEIVEAVQKIWSDRLHQRREDARQSSRSLLKFVKQARRKGRRTTDDPYIDYLVSLSPTMAKQAVGLMSFVSMYADSVGEL